LHNGSVEPKQAQSMLLRLLVQLLVRVLAIKTISVSYKEYLPIVLAETCWSHSW